MKKSESKKTSKILITAGAVLIAAAVFLIALNFYNEITAKNKSNDILNSLSDSISAPENGRIPNYMLNPNIDMPEADIDGNKCIAIIEIPAVNIKLPVISQLTAQNLKIAPCRYSGSAYTNNLVIGGHNYRTHFRSIQNLSGGDAVILTDMDGNVFNYEVEAVDILNPTDVKEMTAGDWDLSLFTCNMSNSLRVTVRCMLKD